MRGEALESYFFLTVLFVESACACVNVYTDSLAIIIRDSDSMI